MKYICIRAGQSFYFHINQSWLLEKGELNEKKKRMVEDIQVLNNSADRYAQKAEELCKLSLISKANRLQRAAKEKVVHLEMVERQIIEKVKELDELP